MATICFRVPVEVERADDVARAERRVGAEDPDAGCE